jgi:acyl-CoA thioesterase I
MRKLIVGIVLVCGQMAAAEEVTIAALGDSLTQGYGLPVDDGFVPQLQRWLDGQGAHVRMINAGVSGDTTAGGLARIGWTLTAEVDAVIVALGGNDLLRGIDPATARANLSGILDAAQTQGVDVLLVGMPAPGNYGTEYKSAFDAIYPELAEEFGAALLSDFFAGLTETEGTADPAALRPYFQADGIHPNAEGVARIVARIGPEVIELAATARQDGGS